MSNVVQLKFKGPDPSDETRTRIELELLRLGERYGGHEVVTVAASFVALAIETTLVKGHPNGVGWVADLKARLEKAFEGL